MRLPEFSAATYFTMVLPNNENDIEHLSPSTDDNMISPAPNSNGTGQPERYEPTFAGLPTELKRMIVHDANDSALPNLRLTNKELNDIASEPFGERCLAERRFMFSKYSMQGLVNFTAHPVFGPCIRKVLFSTHLITNVDDWLETVGQLFPEAEGQAKWKVIQAAYDEANRFFEGGEVFELLAQVLFNLKEHGQKVTLGIFDDVVHRGTDHQVLRKAYGFDEVWSDISPLADLNDEQWCPAEDITLGLIGYVLESRKLPLAPLELDLARTPRSEYGKLGHILVGTVMKRGKLHRGVDVCMRVAFDWTFRLYRLNASQDHLVFDYRGTVTQICAEDEVDPDFIPDVHVSAKHEPRYDFGSGNCSLYSPCVLGDFNKAIGSQHSYEIYMEAFATEAPYLVYGIVATGAMKLQKLSLIDAHLFGPGTHGFVDEKGSVWPYVSVFRDLLRDNCPSLRRLVLERVFYDIDEKASGRAVITEKRREWKGRDGVLSGLDSLISEMTTLNQEQQERWFNKQIDADGNEVAPAATEG